MLAKEGTQLFLLLHVSCVAEIVHSSEVKLGSAGVATLLWNRFLFFRGRTLHPNFLLLPSRDRNFDVGYMYLGYGLYYDLLHQLTQLWWGAIIYGCRALPDWTRGTVSHTI